MRRAHHPSYEFVVIARTKDRGRPVVVVREVLHAKSTTTTGTRKRPRERQLICKSAWKGQNTSSQCLHFRKGLVANRGEIAVGSSGPAASSGSVPSAVYRRPTRSLLHVAVADEAYRRSRGARRQLPQHRADDRRGAGSRRRRDPPRLRLPRRERGLARGCADAGLVLSARRRSIELMGNKVEARAARCGGRRPHRAGRDGVARVGR